MGGMLSALLNCSRLMGGLSVAGLSKRQFGRVDQLEDRYLGMVEAPSSNLGTSTLSLSIDSCGRTRGESNPDVFELPSLALSPVLTRSSQLLLKNDVLVDTCPGTDINLT